MQGENLDTFLSPPFGVAVVCGDVSGFGLFDEPDQIVGAVAISTERSITVRTDLFKAVAVRGVTITVAGVDYLVRKLMQKDDGAFSTVILDIKQ